MITSGTCLTKSVGYLLGTFLRLSLQSTLSLDCCAFYKTTKRPEASDELVARVGPFPPNLHTLEAITIQLSHERLVLDCIEVARLK
jgi:hypothetical protein